MKNFGRGIIGLGLAIAFALLTMGAAGPGPSGGGGSATNAIDNLNGLGTNTTLKGTTTISNVVGQKASFSSNVTIRGSEPMLWSAFQPGEVADLAVWLDATTNTYTQGQQVTQWLGRVSSATNAAGPYFYTNAINGRPAMRFFGTNRLNTLATFSSAENTNFTAFVVAQNTNAAVDPGKATISVGGAAWFMLASTASGNTAEAPGIGFTGLTPATLITYYIPWGYQTNTAYLHSFSYNGKFLVRGINRDETELAVTGNLGLSGAMIIGDLSSGSYAYTGDIAEIIVYRRWLTTVERQAVTDYLMRKWNPRVASRVVFAGNSLTAGTGAGAGLDYVSQLTNSLGTNVVAVNSGTASKTTSAFFADAANIDAACYPARPDNIFVFWEITNELIFGTNVFDAYSHYAEMMAGRKAAGFKTVAMTVLPRTASPAGAQFEADRLLINGLIRTNWPSFADGLADVASISVINTPASTSNTTYYADQVHLTAYGYSFVADSVRKALNKVGGTNLWAK